MQNIVNEIIADMGGDTRASEITGWPVSSINSWKLGKPNIPHWRRKPLLDAARKEKIKLSASAVSYLEGVSIPQEDTAA